MILFSQQEREKSSCLSEKEACGKKDQKKGKRRRRNMPHTLFVYWNFVGLFTLQGRRCLWRCHFGKKIKCLALCTPRSSFSSLSLRETEEEEERPCCANLSKYLLLPRRVRMGSLAGAVHSLERNASVLNASLSVDRNHAQRTRPKGCADG